MNKFTLIIAFAILVLSGIESFAQGSAGDAASYESRNIVDMPTAGVLPKGKFVFGTQYFAGGGMLAELQVSPFVNFTGGLSFGGENIIGSGDPIYQNLPGIQLKYRFYDERLYSPAFAIGFSSQGHGAYSNAGKRFEVMSPGFYIAVSKNFNWALGNLATHGGLNYSFEPSSSTRSLNFYLGVEQSVGSRGSVSFEYNATLDDKNKAYKDNQGMLNSALRYSIGKGFTFEIQLRDLLDNSANGSSPIRWAGAEWIGSF